MNNIRTKRKRNNGFSKTNASRPNGRRTGKKKAVSSIDPKMLVKKAVKKEESKYVPTRSFDEMPLNVNLKANIYEKGFSYPTQIQDQTLELLLEGRDMVGVANTGTGKTGAFLIPIINQLLDNPKACRALVVVPTRELAVQVEEEFKSLTKGLGLFVSSFIGGTNVGRDMSQLRRKNHVIIGTPGRLIDLISRDALKMNDLNTLVLDEFDRMLDMGFVNDIKKMVNLMHNRKQTMLFSATIDNTQKSLIKMLLHDPVEVKVSSGKTTSDHIDQDIIHVPAGEDKFKMLLDLIDDKEFEKVLVFAETKRMADKVAKKLNQSGLKADQIHGNKSQNYRMKALNRFKKGDVKVLVATDVAARGIDVSDVTHVINYQLPLNFDSYVHRIGRTGRGGKSGKAFTFIDPSDN
ncbi:DEAD/DEAH box helicase [Fulvivirga sediminis]|uniref:DEAD/DEAH box helicase n=1 Tax=Fulvivirga sediminis TaxID=2803949 RepID=A0A937FDN0_9BACT|nr:DEAD/DEAH box helicase [Fulvivirga sediminis]MBL3658618.1 DEAD/DEAH box helicase [Fulvivirga sediminis]